jgi:hypothetical protein
MQPETLQKVAQAINSSHHQHVGITTHPPKPPHAPAAARLEHKDLSSFGDALDNAREFWPNAPLALIGAHGVLGTTNIDDPTDTLPPGFAQFLDPEILLPFPIDDPEADDQLNN